MRLHARAGARRLLLRSTLLVGASALSAFSPGAWAQADGVLLEKRVKAAFLYKFIAYVAWPESAFAQPDSPVVIGVMGDDALAAELTEAVAGRKVDRRPLVVRRLRESEVPSGVHVLFVAAAESARLAAVARSTGNQPVLLVSDADGGLGLGSIINFVVTGGRVKFEIAPDTAERRGVKLSSRLLTVAQNVRTGAAP